MADIDKDKLRGKTRKVHFPDLKVIDRFANFRYRRNKRDKLSGDLLDPKWKEGPETSQIFRTTIDKIVNKQKERQQAILDEIKAKEEAGGVSDEEAKLDNERLARSTQITKEDIEEAIDSEPTLTEAEKKLLLSNLSMFVQNQSKRYFTPEGVVELGMRAEQLANFINSNKVVKEFIDAKTTTTTVLDDMMDYAADLAAIGKEELDDRIKEMKEEGRTEDEIKTALQFGVLFDKIEKQKGEFLGLSTDNKTIKSIDAYFKNRPYGKYNAWLLKTIAPNYLNYLRRKKSRMEPRLATTTGEGLSVDNLPALFEIIGGSLSETVKELAKADTSGFSPEPNPDLAARYKAYYKIVDRKAPEFTGNTEEYEKERELFNKVTKMMIKEAINATGGPMYDSGYSKYEVAPTAKEKQEAFALKMPVGELRKINKRDPSTGKYLGSAAEAMYKLNQEFDKYIENSKLGKILALTNKANDFIFDNLGGIVKGGNVNVSMMREFVEKGENLAEVAKTLPIFRKDIINTAARFGMEPIDVYRKIKQIAKKQDRTFHVIANDILNNSFQTDAEDEDMNPFDFYERIMGDGILSNFLSKIRGKYPGQEAFEKLMKDHGGAFIRNITVYRAPVGNMLGNIVDWFTKGDLKKQMQEKGYDKLFHLSMVVQLSDGYTFTIEKNEKITIHDGDKRQFSGREEMEVFGPLKRGPSLNDFMQTGLRKMGEKDFFVYHPFDANCQDFIYGLLNANGMGGEKVKAFIKQDVDEVAKKNPAISKLLGSVTDLAAAVG